jgi:hypothetical protein
MMPDFGFSALRSLRSFAANIPPGVLVSANGMSRAKTPHLQSFDHHYEELIQTARRDRFRRPGAEMYDLRADPYRHGIAFNDHQ